MRITISCLLTVLAIASSCPRAHAGRVTWNLTPSSILWDTAENWTPATVPKSGTDVATFDASRVDPNDLGNPRGHRLPGAAGRDETNASAEVQTTMMSVIVRALITDVIVGLSADFEGAENLVDSIVSAPAATAYTLPSTASQARAGIVNNSEKLPNFFVVAAPGLEKAQAGAIFFAN